MIQIHCDTVIKRQHNFWNNIHFHPTDAIEDEWGQRILDEVARDNVAETVRMYAMLEDIVSMDGGRLRYDYSLCDQRIDYLLSKGFNILLCYNFIPPCIATDPTEGASNSKNKTRYKGKLIVTSPPRDYSLWEEICYQFTAHIVERYGLDTVSKWYLQCFNEPDIGAYFMKGVTDIGTRVTEYLKLYRGFEKATRRVSDRLRIGGPALAHEVDFLDAFFRAVKQENLKLDFFSGHTYGTSPRSLNSGEKPFHVNNTLDKLQKRYVVLVEKYFGKDFEIIIDEWGAASSGFWNKEECPQLMLRETSGFAAYFGKLITAYIRANVHLSKMLICLSGQHEMVTDFSGFRGFFTLNFFKKPIYNAYILASKLHENILASETDQDGLEVLATKDDGDRTSVLLSYASEHFDRDMPQIEDRVALDGIHGRRRVTVWCIDETHTNPYTRMLRENMQEKALSEADIAVLREEGCMKPVAEYEILADGSAEIGVRFTNNALVLVEIQ